MDSKILEMGYYWYGYSSDTSNIVSNHGICHSEKVSEKPPNILKIMIIYWHHKRYQEDLWYLPEEYKMNNEYLYWLDIIDHFNKRMSSYILKN